MELPYAGLHALCAPLLDGLERLPAPQREALNTAFGVSAGPPPDRFLVALAALSLLAGVAEERPLLCIVDDAQWLDLVSAQSLAFVARRLLAERVGLVFARRESGDRHALDGLPELVVEGLGDDVAESLLDATIPGPLDGRVRARILIETRGNPLALIELPRGLAPAELAGGFGVPEARGMAGRLERSFLGRIAALPREARLLLLTAAAEPLGDVHLLWRAAQRLGVGPEAGRAAEATGLIELELRVRFAHPLVRSAVYRAADPGDRRDVHQASALSHKTAGPWRRLAGPDARRRAHEDHQYWRARRRTPFADDASPRRWRTHDSGHSRKRPTPSWTRTAVPGTTRTRPRRRTKRWPPSWHAPPTARSAAAGWPRRPRSCSVRPS